MKDRLRGPEFLSLNAASCLSKFTQTWREKPAKLLRLHVLFRQIVQTWRENQAHPSIRLAHSGLISPVWRETRPLAALSHKKPSIHTKWIPGRNHLQPAPAHGADLRRCRCSSRTRLRKQELPDASGNTLSVQAKVRKQHVTRSRSAKGAHTSKAHRRGQLLSKKLSNRSSKAR